MRIAVFSDVHGNPFACEAVLKAILMEQACDACVVAGDICLGGSDPSACVDMIRESGVRGIYGNTEIYLNHPDQFPMDDNHRAKWGKLQPAVYWTRSKLSHDEFDWLKVLPFSWNFSPTQDPANDLLIVHANPRDVELMIYPDENKQWELWQEIRQSDDDLELEKVLEKTLANTLVFGHFHLSSIRKWRKKRLVNVASCSLPGVDYDRRARYTLFEWLNGDWKISQRWINYDADREINALYASDMPSKDFFISYFG